MAQHFAATGFHRLHVMIRTVILVYMYIMMFNSLHVLFEHCVM